MAGFHFKMLKETHILEKQAKIVLMSHCRLKSKHINEGYKFQAHEHTSSRNYFHQSQTPDYPATKQLPLPLNIKELASTEKLKFSPKRNRDISGSFISSSISPLVNNTETVQSVPKSTEDERIECYDCSGTINLSSVMQTNVPFPFVSRGKPIHLNMPGGQWGQKEKYVSGDLNNAHHTNSQHFNFSSGGTVTLGRKTGNKTSYMLFPVVDPMFSNSLSSIFSINCNSFRGYCTQKSKVESTAQGLTETNTTDNVPNLTMTDKLKAAIRDYGAVVLVFHIGISLISLGCCYLIISSGADFSTLFKNLGMDENAATAENAARFIVAYGVHKAMAPGRIAITLGAAPFIVKKLRKIGILKTPKPKPQ